jgi:uncharacterized membrane protein YbhN (UPF0104 family)
MSRAVRALRRPRLFASQLEEPRSRRASDVIRLVGALVGLALLGAVAVPPAGVERSFMAFVSAVPDGFVGLWRLLILALDVLAVILVVAAAAGRKWAVLRDLAVACGLALALSAAITRLAAGSWPPSWDEVWDSIRALGPARYFPPLSIGLPVAAVLTASPHLTEPARRTTHWLIALALIGTLLHDTATPTGVTVGVLVGTAAAAAVHLIFGSCRGRPSLDAVARALTELGIEAHSLAVADRQAVGVFVVSAVDRDGADLVIKVYGRDAHDTQLLTTLWRTIWYRSAGSPTSFGRRQQAEHEAFLTLLARQSGISTQQVVTAGATCDNDVLLVLRRTGTSLEDAPGSWDDALTADCWHTLRQLHETGIAHGQFDDRHLSRDGTVVGMIDFRGATVAPSDAQLRTDEAQLLVTTSLAVGTERAVSAAVDALGAQPLVEALPFVQQTALTPRQRAALRRADIDLDALRTEAATAAGAAAPELRRLRRVTARSVLQVVLLVAAFLAVAAALGALDLEALFDQVRDATGWLVLAAVILAQVPRLTAAVSVLGASPVPLPLGPVYALQLATSYITLAIPTTAARVAVNVRFLQRHGLRAATALAVGAIDAVTEFLVQIALVAALILLTPATLHLDLGDSAPSGMTRLIAVIVAVAAAAILVVVLVPKWRRAIYQWLRGIAVEALEAARGLRSPRRLGLLLGANVGTELILAVTLQTFVRALGFQVGLAEILLITVSVRVISGLVPIPGGIGVAEGGLAFGLVRAGVPDEVAFAAVLLYRLATFYLPPIWGFFALRWLERTNRL